MQYVERNSFIYVHTINYFISYHQIILLTYIQIYFSPTYSLSFQLNQVCPASAPNGKRAMKIPKVKEPRGENSSKKSSAGMNGRQEVCLRNRPPFTQFHNDFFTMVFESCLSRTFFRLQFYWKTRFKHYTCARFQQLPQANK